MILPTKSRISLTNQLKICRILNGMWQVSGAHGYIDKDQAIAAMKSYVDYGYITWDLADHYGPAEDYVKEFREKYMKENSTDKEIRFFTKWVPRPQSISKKVVRKAIDISRKRMGMDILDMVQFHWWDYNDKNYLKAMEFLDEFREEGILISLGLTNFDSEHVKEFSSMGINVCSNQVQCSLIDRRPEILMAGICNKYGIKIFAYGTLCGGLLSEKYIDKPEPLGSALNTASLYKYKNIIDRWGDWMLFQRLLKVLKEIAEKHNVSIANVAVRYVLENPVVAGVIVGVRLGVSEHLKENAKVFDFSLNQYDIDQIENVLSRSNNLFKIIGDCGDEYRS